MFNLVIWSNEQLAGLEARAFILGEGMILHWLFLSLILFPLIRALPSPLHPYGNCSPVAFSQRPTLGLKAMSFRIISTVKRPVKSILRIFMAILNKQL